LPPRKSDFSLHSSSRPFPSTYRLKDFISKSSLLEY
jgi:hypothetical protein